MFESIKIEKSGDEIKQAAKALLNKIDGGLIPLPSIKELEVIKILSSSLNGRHRYNLTIEEIHFLGL